MMNNQDPLLGFFYAPLPYQVNFQYVGEYGPLRWSGYRLSQEVKEWVQEQSVDQVLTIKDLNNIDLIYFLAPELEVWMKLKFSGSLR